MDDCFEKAVYETDLINQEQAESSADNSGNRGQIPACDREVFTRVRDRDGDSRSHQHHADDRSNAKDQQIHNGP